MVSTADAVGDRAAAPEGDATDQSPLAAPGAGPRRPSGTRRQTIIECAAVLASPATLFYALRLRAMAPLDEPDPSMHGTFIFDPRDIFTRYTAVFTPTSRLREAARVGFLVPARISYLLFGAVPGFFVFRYLLALVAVVPLYVLLRRLYGRGAGALGIIVVLSCPVIITAWGTDYPDSAVVSYAAGALACLAMPSEGRGRRGWIAAAGVLLTMAVWAHGIGFLLAGATLACYGLVRLARDRRGLLVDIALIGGVAIVVTAALSVASELLLGHFDFILPTWNAFRFLSQPYQLSLWHSASWRWAPYVSYILVPPAVLGAYLVAFARRPRSIPTPQLLVGVVFAGQIVAYFVMQFFGNVQTLEMHLFSSTLWGAVCIGLAFVLAELAGPLLEHPWGQWLPAAGVLVVALVYGIRPHMTEFGWMPYGALTAVALVAIAAIARAWKLVPDRTLRWVGTTGGIMGVAAFALVLTVAEVPVHAPIAGTVPDPRPAYAMAIGGRVGDLIDAYAVTSELPAWVGHPTYGGEQLLTWWRYDEAAALLGPIGIYHSGFNSMKSSPPDFTSTDAAMLAARRPGEILVFGLSGNYFDAALRSLAAYRPEMLRRGILSSGKYHLHVMLVLLRSFVPPVAAA